MRRLAGLLVLLIAACVALLLWRSRDEAAAPPDLAPRSAVAAGADAPPASGTSGAPGTADEPAPVESRVPVAADRPGARVRGRLRLGDAALADARIDVWRRPYGKAEPARVAQLRSDAGGAFEAAGLDAERHVLVVEDERVPLATVVAEVRPGEDSVVELGELVIRAPGTASARVVDEAGLPLAGVRVVLVHGEWRGPEMRLGSAGGEAGRWPERQTDAEGSVHFERVPPGRMELLFDAPEFLPRTRWGEIADGGAWELGVVELRRGRRLDGRVVDWSGAPVAGASVTVKQRSSFGPRAERRATTDVGGRFVLVGMPTSGVPALAIEAEGHVPIVCDDYATSGVAEIRLPRGFWITGTVRGAPAEAARVRVDEADGSDNGIPFESRYRLCSAPHEVGADGRFRVGPFLPGRWKLWADAGAHGSSPPVEVAVAGEDLELDLEVPSRAGLEVVVRDASGAPVAGARVAWQDGEDLTYPNAYREPNGHRIRAILQASERSGKHLETDADGGARLPIDLDRPFAIAVRPEGGVPQGRGFVDGERPERVEFVVPVTGTIRVTLLGDAAASVSVSARSVADSEQAFGGKPLGEGVFEIRPVPVGRYRLELYRGGRRFDPDATVQPGERDGVLGAGSITFDAPEVEVAADGTAECEIALPAPGRLHGVVHARGRPVAGCQVFAMELDDAGAPKTGLGRFAAALDDDRPPIGAPVAISGEDGSYGFDVVQAGAWHVYVRHPRGHVASGPWPVRFTQPGQEVALDPRLGGARVAIAVEPAWLRTWPERGSREAYLFRAREAGSNAFLGGHHQLPATASRTPAAFDAEGRARFEFVPAGEYVLRIAVGRDRMLFQRGLVIGTDEDVEIGPLAAPVRHALEVVLEAPPLPEPQAPADPRFRTEHRLGIVVHALFDGIGTPAFVTKARVAGCRAKLELAAGRYEVRAECVTSGPWGDAAEPLGAAAVLTVRADGTFEPETLDLH